MNPLHRPAIARSTAVLVAAGLAIASLVGLASPAYADQTGCPEPVGLDNGSFETPLVAENAWSLFDQSVVDGWSTTEPDGQIEIWHTPFLGVIPFAGDQHAELNANEPSSLYQDVATTPGQRLVWSVAHRGRDGVDTAEVQMGAPGALATQASMTDGQEWQQYSGVYIVPTGETVTRFALTAIATANDAPGIGNLVDAATLTSGACVVSTKSVINISGSDTMLAGDTLRFTIDSVNAGGTSAVFTTLSDTLPAGLTLVPGSITSMDATGPLTEASGDDEADYDLGSRLVTVGVGSGAGVGSGGTLDPGQQSTVTFDATVDAPAPASIANTASVEYGDDFDPETIFTATSNTVSMAAAPVPPRTGGGAVSSGAVAAGVAAGPRLAETGAPSILALDAALVLLIGGLALTARVRARRGLAG